MLVSATTTSANGFDYDGLPIVGQMESSGLKAQVDRAIIDADAFPYDRIRARYIKETQIAPEKALIHERELKRFLICCALSPRTMGMSGPIDEYWHTFVIFTREYAQFCKLLAGRFIHHTPNDDEAKLPNRYPYRDFWLTYERFFQESPPADCWPRLSVITIEGPDFDNERPSQFCASPCHSCSRTDTSNCSHPGPACAGGCTGEGCSSDP